MKKRLAVTLSAVILLTAGLLLVLWLGRAPTSPPKSPSLGGSTPSAAERPPGVKPPSASVEDSAQQGSPDVAVHSREKAPLHLQVVAEDGTPLAGVIATRIPLDIALLDPLGVWPNIEWRALDTLSGVSESNSSGVVPLDEIAASPQSKSSVVWLTHADHAAQSILLESSSADPQIPGLVKLEAAGRLTAQVVNADRSPAAGAVVLELADQTFADPSATTRDELALRVLHRAFRADTSGAAVLDPFPGRHWISAELGGLKSEPWLGDAPAAVTLELRPIFTVDGHVYAADGVQWEPGWRVATYVRRGQDLTLLDRSVVRGDGHWGPARPPLGTADAYVFKLQGGTIAEEEVSLPPPTANATVTVDFHPHPGRTLAIHLVGEQQQDLPGGTVSVNWNHDGTWQKIERKTDAGGIARFTNCAPELMYVRARCPGFAARLLEPIDVSTPPSGPVVVSLARAGRIDGRCVHAGKPVSNFEILFWQGSPNNFNKHLVRDSSDGMFTIDEAPLGELDLFATSDEFPHSEPVHLTVQLEETSSVVLELPDPLTGRGRVVDALSGKPLSNARVQLFSLYGNFKMRPWRLGQPVDSNGAFEIAGFLARDNTIEVSAPGYETRQVNGFGVTGQVLEFNVIGLFGKQAVDIQLTTETQADFTQFRVGLGGRTFVPEQPFPAEGRLRFPALDPGSYSVRITEPGGSLLFDSFVLQPGRDVHVEVPLNGRHLGVQIVPAPGEPLSPGAVLRVCFETAGHRKVEQYYRVANDGHVDIARVEGAEVVLQVEEDEGAVLGVEHIALGPTEPTAVTIVLQSSSTTFRVLDASHNRLSGVRLTLTRPEDSSGWLQYLETNASGECSVRGLSFEKVFVNLFDSSFGVQPSLLVDLGSDGGDPIELTLAPHLKLRVLALERAQPVQNLELRAADQRGLVFGLGSATSNAEGVASWGPVGAGDFKIEVRHPGYWPSDHSIHVTQDSPPTQIQVRRLGNVDITIKNNYGNPVPGVAVDLYSVEEKQWVSSWVKSGMVPSPVGGMTTDSEGHVKIQALPNGDYRWRTSAAESEPKEGEFTLAAQATTPVAIELR